MKLPIYKRPRYLSPSGYQTFRHCQYLYYLLKMTQRHIPYEPQSLPAAIGNAFDLYVKNYIAEYYGYKFDFEFEIRNAIDNPKTRSKAIDIAERAFLVYLDTAMPYIIEEGVAEIETTKDRGFLSGRPDAILMDGTVLDWKMQGFVASPRSPAKGYVRCWRRGRLQPKPHKDYGIPLEQINEKWAVQLFVYSYLAGHNPGKPLRVAIDNVTTRINSPIASHYHKNTIVVSQIRTHIEPSFQLKTWDELVSAWDLIQSGEIEEPEFSDYRCNAFKRPCRAHKKCEYYTVTQVPDSFKKMFE